MSEYKMVPVVATEEMVAAIRDRGTQDGDCVEHTTAHMMWADALDEAPPFVVTDEMAEAALTAYRNHPLPQKLSDMQKSNRDAMRAAIEAVLGGGE